MQLSQPKTPIWYWILSVIAVLWNAGGAWNYVAMRFDIQAVTSQLTPEMVAYFEAFPLWQEFAWGLAVWTAFAGSILLLVRMKLAALLFLVSIISYIVSSIYSFGLSNAAELMGMGGVIFSVVIFLSLLFFFWMARWASSKGILK